MVAAMKQNEAAKAFLDLDDLERQIAAAAAPRKVANDDPLAELARIVGHGDKAERQRDGAKAAGGAASFEDFLRSPPKPLSGAMPPHTPRIEPLFAQDQALPQPVAEPQPAPAAPEPQAVVAEPAPPPTIDADTFTLRPALGDEPAPPAIDDYREFAAAGAPPAEPAAKAATPAEATAEGATQTADPQFDAMLAEFEATMRQVGARKASDPPAAPAEPAALAFPPPPPAMVLPRSLAYDPETEPAEMAPAPAPRGSRRGLVLAGGVMGVALIGAASLLAFGGGTKSPNGASAPVIAAKPGVIKERPANPGGVEVPNQDKEILSPRREASAQPERVAPREEQPLDLAQAQRSAEAQAPAVRQIPGVPVVTPPVPPAAAASTPAQPRPVASVPITIAAAPPAAAPPPPALTAPAPAAPPVTPPAAAAPAPAPASAAPAQPPAAAPAATAQPPAAAPAATAQPPAAAPAPPSGAEPRRVRAVPIRPEEGAPNRAQPQPRVVPPAARPAPAQPSAAAAAEDANAPLPITPQANRVPQQPERSAAIVPGTVPASTPTAPATTQSTSAAPASGGGSFTVQVAAEGSEDAAQAKFNRLRSQYGDVLGSANPSIRSAEVNGRSVYRVRVGQMSREEATSLCERLKASGGSCFVARN
jgi:cell division septation protein DedD